MTDERKITIPIGGMSCQHCVSAVTGALSVLPGITGVDVSLDKGQAVVTGTDIDVTGVRAAIEELGFDAGEVA